MLIKKIALSLLIMVFSTLQANENEFLQADVFTKWTSPTPWVEHREGVFVDMLPHNAIVIEVGVQAGDFASCILKKTHPRKLYLIDCWDHQDPDIYRDPDANVSNVEQERLYQYVLKKFESEPAVAVIRQYSKNAAQRFANESIDWIFIDANHGYDAIKEDIQLWWPKVKKGGFLSGHDYNVYPGFGIVQAVNEFLKEQNLYFSILTTKDVFDSWAIQKPM